MDKRKTVAIVLAAGVGKRMGGNTPKQYLLLDEKPILYYALKAFENSKVDNIVLVVGKNDIKYCAEEIIEKYQFKKVSNIIEGGKERYNSVYNGLCIIKDADYVLIHDGARPFITEDIINDTIHEVQLHKACIVGVPSKDTIKLVNELKFVSSTPNRDTVWSVQTPQAFSYPLIIQAYNKLMEKMDVRLQEHEDVKLPNITDDAMVVEYIMNYPVKLVMGSYSNIKITTPEDLLIGKAILDDRIQAK